VDKLTELYRKSISRRVFLGTAGTTGAATVIAVLDERSALMDPDSLNRELNL
jgi:hypothetical protein